MATSSTGPREYPKAIEFIQRAPAVYCRVYWNGGEATSFLPTTKRAAIRECEKRKGWVWLTVSKDGSVILGAPQRMARQ